MSRTLQDTISLATLSLGIEPMLGCLFAVDENAISDEREVALAKALQSCASLRTLNLSNYCYSMYYY